MRTVPSTAKVVQPKKASQSLPEVSSLLQTLEQNEKQAAARNTALVATLEPLKSLPVIIEQQTKLAAQQLVRDATQLKQNVDTFKKFDKAATDREILFAKTLADVIKRSNREPCVWTFEVKYKDNRISTVTATPSV